MKQIVDEGVEVTLAAGVRLPDCDIFEKAIEVAERTAANKSSMLQDIEKKRRTEIDSINGRIAKIGKKRAIATPVNSTLVGLITGIEEGRGK